MTHAMSLTALALAPALVCAIYIFIRDKYEKEPFQLLITGVLFGAILTAPIVQTEDFITLFMPDGGLLMEAAYDSYAVAALSEEGLKYLTLFFLVWRNRNFNERFDGIVYGAFIALGFAGVENVLFVLNPTLGGVNTGLIRAVLSVPAHAIFGIMMGYYFAMIKFEPEKKYVHAFKAFFVPWLIHGSYDFILLSGMEYMMLALAAFTAYLWFKGYKNMKSHIEASPFKPVQNKTA
ncbi:MAG: PrsW family intramembrane metalloprotease [Clostridiales bacterium]|jgi:RsiW-degrading membrane proteinase PrsW (M82 family)|nr:PrsW family intramembrane metalloprotease [Clostridiales bacterium]